MKDNDGRYRVSGVYSTRSYTEYFSEGTIYIVKNNEFRADNGVRYSFNDTYFGSKLRRSNIVGGSLL